MGAEELAAYLRGGARDRPGRTLADVRSAERGKTMDIPNAVAIHEDTSIERVLGKLKLPVVVTRPVGRNTEKREIVGIVTAFDLL